MFRPAELRILLPDFAQAAQIDAAVSAWHLECAQSGLLVNLDVYRIERNYERACTRRGEPTFYMRAMVRDEDLDRVESQLAVLHHKIVGLYPTAQLRGQMTLTNNQGLTVEGNLGQRKKNAA
jgi:hypothetical protein